MKLDELAKLAGVSRTTASYVVNGKAKQYRVSDRTIEKVKALIKEYDFKPDALAAGLRAGKSKTIGLIIPDFENISYARIANQLENSCREKGYQLLIGCSNDNEQNEMACAKQLLRRKVDALIVSTALAQDSDYYTKIDTIPIVGFDRKIANPQGNIFNVVTDDEQDAYCLTEALFQKPYQNILFLGALPTLQNSKERENGFRRSLEKHQAKATFLYAERFHKQQAAAVFQQWLMENPIPDAIFTTSLTLLQGVIQVILSKHSQQLDNLAIATFGNHEMLDLLKSRVICSVQNHQEIVNSLLDLTFSQFKQKKYSPKPLQQPIKREIISRN